MPRVYITQRQKDGERIKRILRRRIAKHGMNISSVAEKMGITHQALSYKLNNASVTLLDLMEISRIVGFELGDLAELLGMKIDNKNERYLKEILFLLRGGKT